MFFDFFITEEHKLIRDDDEVVYGDAGYSGLKNREKITANPQKSGVEYRINLHPGKINKLPEGFVREFEKYLERR